MNILREDSLRGWAVSAVGAVLLAVAANAYVFLTGAPDGTGADPSISQTGPVGTIVGNIVPFVWLFLYAGLGTAFWLVSRGRPRIPAVAWMVLALLLFCLAYPLYTDNFRNIDVALAGNFATVVLAGFVAGLLWPHSRIGAGLVGLVICWVSLASVGLVALLTGRPF